MRHHRIRMRLLTSAALVAALATGACQTTGNPATVATTGSIGAPSGPRSENDWRREGEIWGERYRKDNKDAEAAVRYAQALRATGQRPQAAAVLEQASIYNPKNTTVLGAYGRALADVGNYAQALEVLGRAHTPDQPDWRILSAQGAVLDQMGRHQDAQRHYASALKITPDEPSVLSNLGLSYALSKNLKKAEDTLRRANDRGGGERKVRQNLALVVGLQGRFAEAEQIARGDLTEDEAEANVAFLRQMLDEEKERKKSGRKSRPLREAASS